MLKTIAKFFKFAGSRSGSAKKSIVFAAVNTIFESFKLFAIVIVLKALVEQNMSLRTVWMPFGIMLVSMTGVIIFRHASRMANVEASLMMCFDHRIGIGERMKYMPMGFFNKNSLGRITSAVTSTMEDIQDVAPMVFENILNGFIYTAIIAIVLTFFDWRIGLIAVSGILLFAGINLLMQRKSRKVSPLRLAAQANFAGAVLEYIQGMSVVKAFNHAGYALKKINKAIEECEKQNIGLELAFIPFIAAQGLLLRLISVLFMAASIVFYLNGTMELYRCLLMLIASFLIYSKLEAAGSVSAFMRMIDISIDKVNSINNTPLMDTGGREIMPENFDIAGRNISFSYEDKKIIEDLSFSIPQGTTTALVGPSGGGKTTLCKLITRFWDVDEGEITLGGVNIKEYTLDSLLANISMVFQSVYLFNDTVAANIRFGRPCATMEQVIEAARKACCHDFIMELPHGYETVVGEGGATISGGEKQRISIARAILKDAPIIILDEATASIDPGNEAELQRAIAELTKSKTIIMIAHRLNTVRHADQILVLENGRIVQKGRHDELYRAEGIYRNFCNVREEAIGWKIEG